jgi:hypothetical protein
MSLGASKVLFSPLIFRFIFHEPPRHYAFPMERSIGRAKDTTIAIAVDGVGDLAQRIA